MDVDVEQIVRTYLKDVILLSLATSSDNKPWVCELIFAYDDELNLYFRSLTKRRHSQQIAANPNVAGIIARPFRFGEFPHGVYFEGTAELLTSEEDQYKAFRVIQDRLHLEDKILAEAQDPEGNQFYKITVREWRVFIKANADNSHGETHILPWAEAAQQAN
jgi:uncharacterized protein YhbP (UPF0306 family)